MFGVLTGLTGCFAAGLLWGAIYFATTAIHDGYVSKHPQLSETPKRREARKNERHVRQRLTRALEDGQISRREYDRRTFEEGVCQGKASTEEFAERFLPEHVFFYYCTRVLTAEKLEALRAEAAKRGELHERSLPERRSQRPRGRRARRAAKRQEAIAVLQQAVEGMASQEFAVLDGMSGTTARAWSDALEDGDLCLIEKMRRLRLYSLASGRSPREILADCPIDDFEHTYQALRFANDHFEALIEEG